MRSKAALLAFAAVAGAVWLLQVRARDSRAGLNPVLAAALQRAPAAKAAPAVSAAPLAAPATALPEASSSVAAPGGPIAVSTGPVDEVTPTTLGTLPARF
ncbi:MAG: hypothetical protein PHU21_09310 [Elusimicrobia bacterium]|jgi:hypothetical protein|nr:hypothetical protein [Elusimicrobiota bacterium]